MKSLVGRRLTYVKLHGGDAFVPGGPGSLGTTLPPQGHKTLTMVMTHTETGVHVKESRFKSEFVIPWGNIQIAVYAPEEKLVSNETVTDIARGVA